MTSRSWVDCRRGRSTLGRATPSCRLTAAGRADCVWGTNRSTLAKVRPYDSLVLQHAGEAGPPASCTDLASRVRPRPDTHRSSTYTAWLSRMIVVDSLWCQSRRGSATRACARGDLHDGLGPVLIPLCLRDSSCCNRLSFVSPGAGTSALTIFVPSDRTAKCGQPQVDTDLGSRPAAEDRLARCSRRTEAKYRPGASLMTVTETGLGRKVTRPADLHIADLRQLQPCRCPGG